jgi:hypothetical protein
MNPDHRLIRLVRLLPWLQVAGNLAVAAMAMQAIITGVFPFSHHWIIPFMAAVLLAQSTLFFNRGPVWPLAALSLFLLAIGVARLRTIWESHHLIHLAFAFALCAVHHQRLSAWASPPFWQMANRRWGVVFMVVAAWAAVLAWRQGIWWGINTGA